MNAPLSITTLAAAWLAAKADEKAANGRRIEIEGQILAGMPAHGPEDTDGVDGNGVHVKVVYKVARTVDSEALSAAWGTLSDNAQKAFKWKANCSMRALQEMVPEDYSRISSFITTKPAKPSVTVEVLE